MNFWKKDLGSAMFLTKDYSTRDVKDTEYKEIAGVFRSNITSINGKTNGLRAQYGRDVAKMNKTKSGQSTDEIYMNIWVHLQSLVFSQPVMKSTSSKNTLK